MVAENSIQISFNIVNLTLTISSTCKVDTCTVGPCSVRFCVVRIWIVRVLKNTPDLHSAYYGFLAFSDHLYYITILV